LCADLDDQEMDQIRQLVSIKKLDRGAILFLQGDPAGGFFVLLSGRVRIYKASPDGKEVTIHIIQPGQMFAEAAIFHAGTFPANCAALEDSTVAFFPKDAFLDLVKNSPQISLKMIGSLAAFVREFTLMVEDLSLKEVPARLASYFLARLDESGGSTFDLDISKTQLAHRLGTIAETLSRNLRKFRELGVIEVDGSAITILDPDRLKSIAEGEKI